MGAFPPERTSRFSTRSASTSPRSQATGPEGEGQDSRSDDTVPSRACSSTVIPLALSSPMDTLPPNNAKGRQSRRSASISADPWGQATVMP